MKTMAHGRDQTNTVRGGGTGWSEDVRPGGGEDGPGRNHKLFACNPGGRSATPRARQSPSHSIYISPFQYHIHSTRTLIRRIPIPISIYIYIITPAVDTTMTVYTFVCTAVISKPDV